MPRKKKESPSTSPSSTSSQTPESVVSPSAVVETTTAVQPSVEPVVEEVTAGSDDTFAQALAAIPVRPTDAELFKDIPADYKLPRRPELFSEIFEQLPLFDTVAEKVLWLRHNNAPAFRYILQVAFHPDVQWLVPAGLPEYKQPNVRHRRTKYSADSEIRLEVRRMYIYLKGGNDAIDAEKRQKFFQRMLEGLDKSEIRCIEAIKDKKMKETYGLTAALVDLAYPNLLSVPFNAHFGKRPSA